jgi:hypothetical protein
VATAEQIEIFEAIRIHTSALETERNAASGFARELLELRLEAARSLLEWLSTSFGLTGGFPKQLQ